MEEISLKSIIALKEFFVKTQRYDLAKELRDIEVHFKSVESINHD